MAGGPGWVARDGISTSPRDKGPWRVPSHEPAPEATPQATTGRGPDAPAPLPSAGVQWHEGGVERPAGERETARSGADVAGTVPHRDVQFTHPLAIDQH